MNRKQEIQRRELDLARNAAEEWRLRQPQVAQAQRQLVSGGPALADTPARVAAFVRRERTRSLMLARHMPAAEVGFEARFGATLDYESLPPDTEADRAGNPVARLIDLSGGAAEGFATGFLISPSLLMTNYHVFPTRQDVRGVAAQFDYEKDSRGRVREGEIFQLDPNPFFISNRELDFAIVALNTRNANGATTDGFQPFLRLIGSVGKILKGHPVHMIHYPGGAPKTYVFREDPLVDVDDAHVWYLTDTEPGSSGAPAFNAYWELIALHHRSVPDVLPDGRIRAVNGGVWQEGMGIEEIKWAANEGVRVSALVAHLRSLRLPSANEQGLLNQVLENSNDPLGGETLRPVAQENSNMDPSGKSGAVHIHVAGGATININAGAGRAEVSTVRPAVLEDVGIEKAIRFDPKYEERQGYDANFFGEGTPLPAPTTSAERLEEMLRKADGKELVLDYHHYSLAMNKQRKLMMWSAVNVDYDPEKRRWFKKRAAFGSDKWIADPRIPSALQLLDAEAYGPSPSLQRGHIVRREDCAWGESESDQEYANSDTFHWTNCTPMHGGFNEAGYSSAMGTYFGIWGGLENKITSLIDEVGQRACIFGGPILDTRYRKKNWGLGPVLVPLAFWKIVCVREEDGLAAYGFVLDQSKAIQDLGLERLDFGKFEVHQKSVAHISGLTGVVFDQAIHRVDVLRNDDEGFEVRGAIRRRARR